MTITEPFRATLPDAVTLDLYRDIHKAIRTELFGLVAAAGRTDASDASARRELAANVRRVVDVLEQHAHHEDDAIGPVLERELPRLAERIERDHTAFDGRGSYLVGFADHVADEAAEADRRLLLHHLYLDLAGFTSVYLAHQDVEERELMPALEAAIGPEAVGAIHGQILASIPPDEMARSLAVMIPAMNLDDRVELLGGMRAQAPDEVFQGVWGLAGSVLASRDLAAVAQRLGLG